MTATSEEWTALENMLSTCSGDVVLELGSELTTQPVVPTETTSNEPLSGETPIYDPFGLDRDCRDFDAWTQSQYFYESSGGPEGTRTAWTEIEMASLVKASQERLEVGVGMTLPYWEIRQ